jgi:integrase
MDKIKLWLDFYKDDKTGTYNTFKSYIKRYFNTVKSDPKTYTNENKEKIKSDIKIFVQYEKNKGTPTTTLRTCIDTLKSFLDEYEIELPKKFWKRINKRVGTARITMIDKIPTNDELKQILQHANLNAKALFLTLATSGMRIDEALRLTFNNIDLDYNPPKIELPANITKTGNPRITFISDEAKATLIEWLKERPKYLESASKKHYKQQQKKTITNDQRIFPFTYQNAKQIWTRLITKAELNEKDTTINRYKIHIHTLRKFFDCKMKATGIQSDIVETMMGHKSQIKRAYDRFQTETLAEEYLKGMESLLVFEQAPNTEELQQRLQQLQKENQELKNEMQSLQNKTKEIDEKLNFWSTCMKTPETTTEEMLNFGLQEIKIKKKKKEDQEK